MATEQKIIKGKVGLLELAKQLGKRCAPNRSRSADRASAALSLPQATKRGNLACTKSDCADSAAVFGAVEFSMT
jgi:hypothetical protein